MSYLILRITPYPTPSVHMQTYSIQLCIIFVALWQIDGYINFLPRTRGRWELAFSYSIYIFCCNTWRELSFVEVLFRLTQFRKCFRSSRMIHGMNSIFKLRRRSLCWKRTVWNRWTCCCCGGRWRCDFEWSMSPYSALIRIGGATHLHANASSVAKK